MTEKPRIVVLISGSGTNLQALIDAIANGFLNAKIALVVSNRKNALGLVRAQRVNIPTHYAPLKPYKDQGKTRADYDRDLADFVKNYRPDLIVMAGWMHIVQPVFLEAFPDKVINLHPALPGKFAGANAIERTYEAFERGYVEFGGCMVHYVVPEVDAGPVIVSAKVPIHYTDSLEDFTRHIHETEHKIIVQAVKIVLGKLVATSS